jgi:hypothetical protein
MIALRLLDCLRVVATEIGAERDRETISQYAKLVFQETNETLINNLDKEKLKSSFQKTIEATAQS